MKLVKKLNIVFNALLKQGLQDHMARSVGSVAGSFYRGLAEITRVPAKPALINPPVCSAAERQTPVLKIVHSLNSLFGHKDCCLLIDEVIPSFNRIEGMPLGFVFFDVSQCRPDTALSGTGMRADRIQFGQNGGFCLLTCFQGSVQPGSTSAYDYRFVFMDHGTISFSF
jgi:hypothetical protein